MKRKRRTNTRVESRPEAIEILTIGWMLMVVTTFACEIGFALTRGLAGGGNLSQALCGVLLFAALVIGLLAMLLTPVVLHSRRARPPKGIVVFATIISAMPLVIAAFESLRR